MVKASPATASNAVTYSLEDSTVATLGIDGTVRGLKPGTTRLRAVSKVKPTVVNSAWVIVSDPVPVESVRFLKDSTELFIGGAAEELGVEVLPSKANPMVEFSIVDSSKININTRRMTALAEGMTLVIVKSKENPVKTDTLKVKVSIKQTVDSVSLTPRRLTLYTGGESLSLVGTVFPAKVTQKLQWSSTNPDIAKVDTTGKVSALSPGNGKIYAISQADSLVKASADISVKRDIPQVSIGQDTTVSLGADVTFLPVTQQEYGQVIEFKWDLNGDSIWDGTAAAVKAVSHTFALDKDNVVRFYVKDTEGNVRVVSKIVKAVSGPIVLIKSPLNNSFTNKAAIAVVWSISGIDQDSLKSETLKEGSNTITRSAQDAAGKSFSKSIIVTFDSLPPIKPQVHGTPYTRSTTPTWSWASGGSGGSGGNGIYRYAIDVENFATAAETKDTLFIPTAGLSEAVHTLFVQERDAAGNWSESGKFSTTVDKTAPSAPVFTVQPPAFVNKLDTRATLEWTWTKTGAATDSFVVRLNGKDVSRQTGMTYPINKFTDGSYQLEISEIDLAGNASPVTKSISVFVDRILPAITLDNYKNVPEQIFSTIRPVKGKATDGALRKLQYQVGTAGVWIPVNEMNPFTFTPSLDTGTQSLTIRALDDAGNQTDLVFQLTYLPKVVFVRKGAKGDSSGTSWANAFPELDPVMDGYQKHSPGTQIWVSEGNFSTMNHFWMEDEVSVSGGFALEGTDRSLTIRDLAKNVSVLSLDPNAEIGYTMIIVVQNTIIGGEDHFLNNITLTDFQIGEADYPIMLNNVKKGKLTNIILSGSKHSSTVLTISKSNFDIEGCTFSSNATGLGTIVIQSSSYVRLINTKVEGNSATWGSGINLDDLSSACAANGSIINGNLTYDINVNGGAFARELLNVKLNPAGISDGSDVKVTSCPDPFK